MGRGEDILGSRNGLRGDSGVRRNTGCMDRWQTRNEKDNQTKRKNLSGKVAESAKALRQRTHLERSQKPIVARRGSQGTEVWRLHGPGWRGPFRLQCWDPQDTQRYLKPSESPSNHQGIQFLIRGEGNMANENRGSG